MLLVMALVAGAQAAPVPTVETSGGVHHVAVCDRVIAPGMARCHAHVVTDDRGVIQTGAAGPGKAPAGYAPADLRAAYNISATGDAATIVAIVDAYGYPTAEADLAVYRAQFGLPACTCANGCFAKYNQKGAAGGYPAENLGWSQESALDLDMASAMCPDCTIILVEAKSASFGDLGAAEDTAAAKGAHVIVNSYGGSESGSQTYEPHYNHPGVAITASTGESDDGAVFPASSPHVTAVGGTTLVRGGGGARGWTETAWFETGDGCSILYAKPAWQTDKGCPMRTQADVAAVADPSTGVAVYGPTSASQSGWQVLGGVSVGAPLIGGVYGANGGPVTYGSDPYAHTGALYDITKGPKGDCPGKPYYFCNAKVGYDGPTGVGTPNGITAF